MGRKNQLPLRRPHRHHNNYLDAHTTNRESLLSLGRLNQESEQLDNHVVVESWLRRVKSPASTTRLASPGPRSPRSKGSHSSHCNLYPTRVDTSWRPQHIPPAQGSLSPCHPQLVDREGNPKRRKQKTGSSSLIGNSSPFRELWKRECAESSPKYQESLQYKSLDIGRADSASTSLPVSHHAVLPAYEKRPRYKTRADKYDLNKSLKRSVKPYCTEHQPRESKPKKRKRHATGKNVMSNFASDAVLNDRITVQPNLRPGLFKNMRVSKKRPVTDLSFSSMRFPTYQEQDAKKGRANSKLSEHRRESRENENVSSFFLPAHADMTECKAKPTKRKTSEESKEKKLTCKDNTTRAVRQDCVTTLSSSNALCQSQRQQSSVVPENLIPESSIILDNPDCCLRSRPTSKGTTYFTWSSTQQSPQPRLHSVDIHQKSIEPARSATPEDARKALLATGVYRETGISPYDALIDQRAHTMQSHHEPTSTNVYTVVGQENACRKQLIMPDQHFEVSCHDDTRATLEVPVHLEERWKRILPPEWKSRRSPGPAESLTNDPGGTYSDTSLDVRPFNRQKVVQEVRINPIREIPPAHDACGQEDHGLATQANSIIEDPVLFSHESNDLAEHKSPSAPNRATAASRDAMPPPPIPSPRCSALHSTNRKPGGNCFSKHHETVKRLEIPVPISPCEYAQESDARKVISEPYESRKDVERVIQDFNSASWIPQAKTSTITSYEREKSISRLGTRSAIYRSQDKDEDRPGTLLGPVQHHTSHATESVTESMTDFIARIETEFERDVSLNEGYQLESMAETPASFQHPSTSNYNIENRHTMAGRLQRKYCQLPVDLIDNSSFTEPETHETSNRHEEVIALMESGSSSSLADGRKEDSDEFLEMSNFWRPNQFSSL
ncbi:hypothetical protein GGS21DRAFT_538349 [Xylaria nigripes]|nr:hypothetical protein GGS21DRAFT_538349 [Xylaria nigripes]